MVISIVTPKKLHVQACKFLFEDVDANGDGKLQFEEFVVMVFHCSADLEKLQIRTVLNPQEYSQSEFNIAQSQPKNCRQYADSVVL